MRSVEVQKREIDIKGWERAREPTPGDYSTLIDEDCILTMGGKAVGLYMHLPEKELAPIRAAVQRIEYSRTYRTGGLKTQSRIVGYQPRVTVRRDFCTVAALAREAPGPHNVVCSGAALASRELATHVPEVWAAHAGVVEAKVKPEWRLPDSAYTSGIVNYNNPLRYHHDAGNIPGTWNAMLTFKKDIEGGFLAVPELDVAFAVRDGTLSIFDAQGLLHGVTPFRKCSATAHRYTIVYYALAGMCLCGTAAEELARIKTVKTQREKKRASAGKAP